MNEDFLDLLRAFIAADVRFLVVGAYALAHHGRPRATAALDVVSAFSQAVLPPDSPVRVLRRPHA